jgi:hypothetical protein
MKSSRRPSTICWIKGQCLDERRGHYRWFHWLATATAGNLSWLIASSWTVGAALVRLRFSPGFKATVAKTVYGCSE